MKKFFCVLVANYSSGAKAMDFKENEMQSLTFPQPPVMFSAPNYTSHLHPGEQGTFSLEHDAPNILRPGGWKKRSLWRFEGKSHLMSEPEVILERNTDPPPPPEGKE